MKKLAVILAAGVFCLLAVAVASPRHRGTPHGSAQAGQPERRQPRFLNARVEERPADAGLAGVIAQAVRDHSAPAWIAYSVPAIAGDHGLCDADRPRRMYLEGRPPRTTVQPDAGPPADLVVLLRSEAGRIQRLRVASMACEIDANGLPLAWLTRVAPAESVALLRGIVSGPSVAGLNVEAVRMESALMAIALHADSSAGPVLEAFAAPGQPTPLRKRAVFWLGTGRGAVDVLVRLARADENLDVRKEAMFWLSRSQDPRAITFTDEVLKK